MIRFRPASFLAATLLTGAFAAPALAQTEDPPIPADTEIHVLPSGVKYSVLTAGAADGHPAFGDKVRVHYTGWTTDGKMFDSSRHKGADPQPAVFSIGNLIDGWNEALQLMTPGSRWKLTIPWNLAYGEQGNPRAGIGQKADLIFDVELIEVVERTMAYVAWDAEAEGVQTTESGLAYRVIEPGEGMALETADMVFAKYGVWNPAGDFVMSSVSNNGELAILEDRLPLRFLGELKSVMRPGARILANVPADIAFGQQEVPKLPVGSHSVWQLDVQRAFKVEKPDFRMPEDSELSTTESGLRYVILNEGTGSQPVATDQVLVHYNGWLTDGTQFDASYDRGDPASFPLGNVIKGWTEGLQLMREGGQAILVVPAELGYGDRGQGQIPGGATLVFFVELLDVR